MSRKNRQKLLRANALFLLAASSVGVVMDLTGAYFRVGPGALITAGAPYTSIGFLEAHGLALIMGTLLWRAAPLRSWHSAAVAVHLLLGTSNIAFWGIFAVGGIVPAGYITTILHGAFAALQGWAWASSADSNAAATNG